MASETSEQRVKAAVPDAQAVETHRNPENGLLERVCIMNGYRKLFPEPSGSTANDAWDDALTHPAVVAFESNRRVVEPKPLCLNCSQPIQRCKPWGWHHADGPVLCYNESELVATPCPEDRVQDAPEVRKYTCDSCMGEFTTATKYRHPLCPLCHVGQGIDHRENGKQEVVREDAEGKPKCKNCGGEVLNGIVHSDGLSFCTDACETVAEAAKPLSPDRPKGFDFDDVPRWIDGDHSEHVLVVLESDFRRLLSAYRALNTAPRQFSISFEDWWSKQYNSTILTPVIEHNRAKNSAEAAWNAALRTRPEGEAKVTWRVEYEDGFERGYDGEDDARKSYAEADNLQMSSCLIKSETVETVLKTRKRKP